MVARKFKILSKRTVCGTVLVTILTQNKASLFREETKGVWRMGYATFVNFVRLYCVCVYY